MTAHLVYLHGFGSSGQTAKAQFLRSALADQLLTTTVPDLDGGDFFHMTIESMTEIALAAIAEVPADGHPIILAGSSLGGYLTGLLAGGKGPGELPQRVAGLLLLAPAFNFTKRWRNLLGAEGLKEWQESGSRSFFHHASESDQLLSYEFVKSCDRYPALPLPGLDELPTTIVHGRQDQTVPWEGSRQFAELAERAEFHLINADHSLTKTRDLDLIASLARQLIAECG